MAIRQYVGARYVPKFWDNGTGSTEWVPNIPYESLVVVTYMNNSYTSKGPVPATAVAPNVDTEHWALTGAYNAQVEQYRQEVEEIKTKIITLQNESEFTKLSNVPNGTMVMLLERFGNRDVSYWIKSASIIDNVQTITVDGANWNYVPNGMSNIAHLIDISTKPDIGNVIMSIIEKGNRKVYIPAGEYNLANSVNIMPTDEDTKQFWIVGESRERTLIKCAKGFIKINITGYNARGSEIGNLSIRGTLTDGNNGIEIVGQTDNDMFDESNLHDMTINNFYYGLRIACRSIWSVFKNLNITGCFTGMFCDWTTVSGNLNTFIDCQFDSNQKEGVHVIASITTCFTNNFISCSIEGNFSSKSGNLAEVFAGQYAKLNFIGCHFEGVDTTTDILPIYTSANAIINVSNSTFIKYKYMYTNLGKLSISQSTKYDVLNEKQYGEVADMFAVYVSK